MHIPIILSVSILFLSCTSDNSSNQSAKSANDSLNSTNLAIETDISSDKGETIEQTSLITEVIEQNGQVFILADYIIRLDGEKAIEEAQKRGDADTAFIDGKMEIAVANDYYTINDNHSIRKLPLDPKVKYELIDNPDRENGKVKNTLQGFKMIYKETPFTLTLEKGRVIKISEIFVP